MIWIYRLLFLPGLLVALPGYWWQTRGRGKFRDRLGQRLGWVPRPNEKSPGKVRVWIQAVSVGELQAIRPLLESLHSRQIEVILTTTTVTGFQLAQERYTRLTEQISYFPIDFVSFSHRAWNRIQPDRCILMEGELWPEHLHQATKRGVPVLLINARMSDRAFQYYSRLKFLAQPVFESLTKVLASSEQSKERYVDLGVDPVAVTITGNVKCDSALPRALSDGEADQMLRELGFFQNDPSQGKPFVICGASTWPGEEEALLKIFLSLRKWRRDLRLLIVPRHMERREEIRRQMKDLPLRFHFRTGGFPEEPVEVHIGDTTGELVKFLQISHIVFVGRSLPPHTQGQTPIEAGLLQKPILFGPGMSNFKGIAQSLIDHGVAEQVEHPANLEEKLRDWMAAPDLLREKSNNALGWIAAHRGANARTLQGLEEFLQKTSRKAR